MVTRVRDTEAVLVVLSLSAVLACSDSGGSGPAGTGGGNDRGANGGSGQGGLGAAATSGGGTSGAGSSYTTLLGSSFGRVTVVGSSKALPAASRTFFGPAQGRAAGDDVVQCTVHPQRDAMGPPRVELIAGVGGQQIAEVYAWFALTSTNPFTEDHTFDLTQKSQSMALQVRLHDSPLLVYEYEYAADSTFVPPIRSLCRVSVTTITPSALAGSIECRDLLATSASPDAAAGSSRPRASATVSFDCTPELAQSGSGTGGAPSTGGAGGSPAAGGAGGTPVTGGRPSTGGIFGAGGVPGGASCRGSATPCSLISSSECALALGCSRDGSCSGSATSCYSEFSDFACISQEGCVWGSSTMSCGGSSKSCYLFSASYSCEQQEGCHWSDSCSGSAWSCDTISTQATCLAQPGCYWL